MLDNGGREAKASNDSTLSESFAPTPEILNLWENVYARFREEFGEAVFRSWLKPLTLQACYHGTLEVSVPTRFMRDWIQTHYSARILQMCGEANDEVKRVEIVVVQNSIPLDSEETVQKTLSKANQNRPDSV